MCVRRRRFKRFFIIIIYFFFLPRYTLRRRNDGRLHSAYIEMDLFWISFIYMHAYIYIYTTQGQKNNITTNWHGRYLLRVGGRRAHIIIIIYKRNISQYIGTIIYWRPDYRASPADLTAIYDCSETLTGSMECIPPIRRGDICALHAHRIL